MLDDNEKQLNINDRKSDKMLIYNMLDDNEKFLNTRFRYCI